LLSFIDEVESSLPRQHDLRKAPDSGTGYIPDTLLPPYLISDLNEMHTRCLTQSQCQELRNRVPDEEIPRVEEIAMVQFLETAQCFSCRDESGCRVDSKVPLEFFCGDVQSGFWGLATGDCVCCCSILAWPLLLVVLGSAVISSSIPL
jgi:hypothetical protein